MQWPLMEGGAWPEIQHDPYSHEHDEDEDSLAVRNVSSKLSWGCIFVMYLLLPSVYWPIFQTKGRRAWQWEAHWEQVRVCPSFRMLGFNCSFPNIWSLMNVLQLDEEAAVLTLQISGFEVLVGSSVAGKTNCRMWFLLLQHWKHLYLAGEPR